MWEHFESYAFKRLEDHSTDLHVHGPDLTKSILNLLDGHRTPYLSLHKFLVTLVHALCKKLIVYWGSEQLDVFEWQVRDTLDQLNLVQRISLDDTKLDIVGVVRESGALIWALSEDFLFCTGVRFIVGLRFVDEELDFSMDSFARLYPTTESLTYGVWGKIVVPEDILSDLDIRNATAAGFLLNSRYSERIVRLWESVGAFDKINLERYLPSSWDITQLVELIESNDAAKSAWAKSAHFFSGIPTSSPKMPTIDYSSSNTAFCLISSYLGNSISEFSKCSDVLFMMALLSFQDYVHSTYPMYCLVVRACFFPGEIVTKKELRPLKKEFLKAQDSIVALFHELLEALQSSLIQKGLGVLSENTVEVYQPALFELLDTRLRESSTHRLKAVTEFVSDLSLNDDVIASILGITRSIVSRTRSMAVATRDTGRNDHDSTHLPIDDHKDDIMAAVSSSAVVIIEGVTGSGKSTMVPLFLLESDTASMIIVTQPRRMAAVALAKRVAQLHGSELGDDIGYAIGSEPKYHQKTKLLYVTTGWLLQKLIFNPQFLFKCSHLVLDEIHERDSDQDLLCSLIKHLCLSQKTFPKFVVMSATLNSAAYLDYFNLSSSESSSTIVQVDVRKFPVDIFHIEDILRHSLLSSIRTEFPDLRRCPLSKVNCSTIGTRFESKAVPPVLSSDLLEFAAWICHAIALHIAEPLNDTESEFADGACILVFCSGMSEIEELFTVLERELLSDGIHNYVEIVCLHSLIDEDERARIFEGIPHGYTRVILSTNIAESSLTIQAVQYVIDFGTVKQVWHRANTGYSVVERHWISRASAMQRAGRTGRTSAGCVFRMYSEKMFDNMEQFEPPELLRVSLCSVVLKLKAVSPNGSLRARPSEIILGTFQAPETENVVDAYMELIEMGALSGSGTILSEFDDDSIVKITSLGGFVSAFPISMHFAKMLAVNLAFGGANIVPLVIMSCLSSIDRLILWPHPVFGNQNRGNELFTLLSTTSNAMYKFDQGLLSDSITFVNMFREFLSIVHRTPGKANKEMSVSFGVNMKKLRSSCFMISEVAGRLLDLISQRHPQRKNLQCIVDSMRIIKKKKHTHDEQQTLSRCIRSLLITPDKAWELRLSIVLGCGPSALVFGFPKFLNSDDGRQPWMTSIHDINSTMLIQVQSSSPMFTDTMSLICMLNEMFPDIPIQSVAHDIEKQINRHNGKKKGKDILLGIENSRQKQARNIAIEFKPESTTRVVLNSQNTSFVISQVPAGLHAFNRLFFRRVYERHELISIDPKIRQQKKGPRLVSAPRENKVDFRMEVVPSTTLRPSIKWTNLDNSTVNVSNISILDSLCTHTTDLLDSSNLTLNDEAAVTLLENRKASVLIGVAQSMSAENSKLSSFRAKNLTLLPPFEMRSLQIATLSLLARPECQLTIQGNYLSVYSSKVRVCTLPGIDYEDLDILRRIRSELDSVLEEGFLKVTRRSRTLTTLVDTVFQKR